MIHFFLLLVDIGTLSPTTHWASLQPPKRRKPCRPRRNVARPRRCLASASCFGIPVGSAIFLESTNFPGEDRRKQGYEKMPERTHLQEPVLLKCAKNANIGFYIVDVGRTLMLTVCKKNIFKLLMKSYLTLFAYYKI